MLKRMLKRWASYKYRFVPWLALNLKDRQIRNVPKGSCDKVITDEAAQQCMYKLFTAFETAKSRYSSNDPAIQYQTNMRVMKESLGFCIERAESVVKGGGTGVRVTDGTIPAFTVTSLYPGTVYHPYEPIFFQSISNPFVFRCIDRMLIDGNNKGLSKTVYKSCSNRDRIGPYMISDTSWLTKYPLNPMAVGQYVNNHTRAYAANVAYQELDIDESFYFKLWKYLPNVCYGVNLDQPRQLRVVVLVSLRDIHKGEELFSSYYTLVRHIS
ncbi:SET domain-containing protein 9-like isoform X2 [Tubulanus polymorphus]|uniref:SET domain-containing protein 9-like isoform X2 n=1 Tax=Tubulanus polymorphus TaxID=672921 RepID=UPI003DA65450